MPGPLKIGIVAPEFPPNRGGVQSYTVAVCTELARRGHCVNVLAPLTAGNDDEAFAFPVERVLALRERLDRVAVRARTVDVWHGMNASCSWLARLTPRAFVSAHGNDFLAPYTMFFRPDLRERWHLPIGSRLDLWLGRTLTRLRTRANLATVAAVFVNSRYTERRLLAVQPRCRGRTHVTPLAADAWFFEEPLSQRKPGPKRLVTVCRLSEPRKNVDGVLRALALLQKSAPSAQWTYTVIGDGPLRESLAQLAGSLGLGDRVGFAGTVGAAALRRMLSHADLHVLVPCDDPNSVEGFGIAYLEAAACGTPSLACNSGGAAEAIAVGESGYMSDGPDAVSIAQAMSAFLGNRVVFDPGRCRAHAARFSWRAVVDSIEAAYRRLE